VRHLTLPCSTPYRPTAIATGLEGKLVAVGLSHGSVIYFGQSGVSSSWSVLRVLHPTGVAAPVTAISFNPAGSRPLLLGVGHGDGEVSVFELEKTQAPHKVSSQQLQLLLLLLLLPYVPIW